MLNKVTVKQKPSSWLNAYLFVCIIAIILAPAVSFAQDISNQASASPGPVNGNPDLIVPLVGVNINCTIDRVDKTHIYYHIKRRGADPQGSVALKQVIKYFYKKQWHEALVVSPSNVKARNLILAENINEAIASYALLISKDSTNATLLAEDAYALALGGIYEAALMRLDRSWSIGANSADVNYLTGQVFALMGYVDITNEIWKPSEKYNTPSWIAPKASALLDKYKTKSQNMSIKNREELIASFKLANELASKNLYFQSIALFHEITNLYPNEYVPYIGYSITMEKTGALGKSAQTIEKAISLIGNNAEDAEKKRSLEQRLISVRQKMTLLPAGTLPGLYQMIVPVGELPQMMAYIGGMASPSFTNLNGRIGYFMTGASNASLDFGITKSAGVSSTNLGLSFYERSKYSVYGAGFQLASVSGNTVYYLKLSVGLSIMNRVRTSSFDLFLDVNYGLKKGDLSTYSLSVGKGIYFGKRK
jgi:tetratricopeptide (TPR) repeat protein